MPVIELLTEVRIDIPHRLGMGGSDEEDNLGFASGFKHPRGVRASAQMLFRKQRPHNALRVCLD
jgi:hypothetical protein